MANRLFYVLSNGKKGWINSQNETIDWSMVSVSADPTSGTHVVRKSFADATYVPLSQKGAANGIATLNADGKLSGSQVPAIAITDTFVVGSEAEMLALTTAETGDVVVRTDLRKCFILKGASASVLADWQELLTPISPVQSVNGQTGVVVLSSDEISEGLNNKYFTVQRARDAAVVNSLAGSEVDQAPSVAAVKAAIASATQASGTVASDLAAEVLRAKGAESALGTRIDNEITARGTAVQGVSDAIAAEVSRATGEESRIEGLVSSEVSRAQQAESALSTKIDDDLWTLDQSVNTRLGDKVDNSYSYAFLQNDSGANILPGSVVYLTADGKVKLAKADSIATCGTIGIARSGIQAGAFGNVLLRSGENMLDVASEIFGDLISPALPFYVSATEAGKMTTNPRTNAGDVLKLVLMPYSQNGAFFTPGESEQIM